MIRLTAAAQNAMLKAVSSLVDGADEPGVLLVYSGDMPAKPEQSANGEAKLLARMKFSRPGFDSPNSSSIRATFETGEMALESGKASWARIEDGAGRAILDISVGDEESNAEMKINTVEIRRGGPVLVRAFILEI